MTRSLRFCFRHGYSSSLNGSVIVAALMVLLGTVGLSRRASAQDGEPAGKFCAIQVLDAETGRGIPLVELKTVNHLSFVTDNAGRIAFGEQGMMDQTIFFNVEAHGYDVPKDGLGITGLRLEIKRGAELKVKLKRRNVAERLYRLTGYGLYRDSVILGKEVPLAAPWGPAKVAGQDSVTAIPFQGKIYWFWGDTLRLSYPLGIFRMAGATSAWPGKGGLSLDQGIDYMYFTDKDGFARNMAEHAVKEGVLWLFGFATVPDAQGKEWLVGHYSRRKSLAEEVEHGMMVWNEERAIFEKKTELPLTEKWRFLDGQPVRVKVDGREYLQGGVPVPNVRVPATLDAVLDPQQYEAFSRSSPNETADSDSGSESPDKGKTRKTIWKWQKDEPPTLAKDEASWLRLNMLTGAECRYLAEDAARPGQRITLHTGTVRWNEYRKKWVMIAVQTAYAMTDNDSPSALGEVWYSEADAPEGPYVKAVRVLSHNKQSFYNPVHHAIFDEQDGRVIYFEGTYTNSFTNSPPTPLYEYNQMMYRLDLNHPKLKAVFGR